MYEANLRFDLDQVKGDEPIEVKIFPHSEVGTNKPQSLNMFITPDIDPSVFISLTEIEDFWKARCVLLSIDEFEQFVITLNQVRNKLLGGL